MKMTCPHCGVIGTAHERLPGEKVRCPQCEKVFRVMEQTITCPHCAVSGSAPGSAVGTKLRCPRCEKVFVLNMERFSDGEIAPAEIEAGLAPVLESVEGLIPEPVVSDSEVMPALESLGQGAPKPESGGQRTEAAASWPLSVDEAVEEREFVVAVGVVEAAVEQGAETASAVEPEPMIEPQLVIEPASVLVPEAEVQVEPQVQPVLEKTVETMGESGYAARPEPMEESVPVSEPVCESLPAAEVFSTAAIEPESDVVAEEVIDAGEQEVREPVEPGPVVSATGVCAGCGGSFHPQLLQEVEGLPHCGVCQLRLAASARKSSRLGGRVRGVVAALVLLGLLALIALLLIKSGLL